MIKIRKADVSDIHIIVEFQKCMALETENLVLDPTTVFLGVSAVLNDPSKGQYFLAECGGVVISSLLVTFEWSDWRNGQVWWLQSLYVVPDFRRKGVFRQMFLFLKNEILNDTNLKGIRLYVDKSNKLAQDVYQALGMDGEHYQVFEWMKD
jgi:ribosomal protein S18 acetylase RimI-like enzyme